MKYTQGTKQKTLINHGFKCAVLMAVAICVMAAGALMDVVVANAKTVIKKKPCLIHLTSPKKETGKCELGINDPAAQIVIEGWRWSRLVWNNSYGVSPKGNDAFASEILERVTLNGQSVGRFMFVSKNFFGGMHHVLIRDGDKTTLDAEPGQTNKWEFGFDAYTKDELKQSMDALIKWAKAWKAYRGKNFGTKN